jgi:hypothetical protein
MQFQQQLADFREVDVTDFETHLPLDQIHDFPPGKTAWTL